LPPTIVARSHVGVRVARHVVAHRYPSSVLSPMRRLLPAVLASCCLPLAAQTITRVDGVPTDRTVTAFAEASPFGPGTVVLQQVEFVPIEHTGRTLAHGSDATRSRRVERHGLVRIELPAGGRLLRYRRAGGALWGFLHVAAGGAPQVVFELPGAGAALTDPFFDRIGIADDGRHAAIAVRAGGLHVVRLDGGVFASTGRADRQVLPNTVVALRDSVMVGTTCCFVQDRSDRLLRIDLADGSTAVDVSPPAVPNGEFKDQMALARDGSRLVVLYGPRDQMRLWSVGTAGGPVLLPPPPSKYEEPGYLPEDPGEPAMLLADDGSQLFCVDSIVRDELHLLDLVGGRPPLQITEDAIFQPYIGVHILPKFRGGSLVLAIGDPQRMDWFRATLTPTGGVVANLTGTGSLLPPFVSGALDPVQAATVGGDLLVTEQTGNGLALRRLDPGTATHAVVQQDLLAAPVVGSAVAGRPADLFVPGVGGDRIWRADGALFAAAPPGVLLSATVHGPDYSASWVSLASGWGMVAYWLHDGTIVGGPVEFDVRQVALSGTGALLTVGSVVRFAAPGVLVTLPWPADAVCLSGAGG
jgi:hypothetical protein